MKLTFKQEIEIMTYLSLPISSLLHFGLVLALVEWWYICSFVWLFVASINNLL
jgi:hypothetical protein